MTQSDQDRPYYDDSTASRLLSEVKHRQVRLVLRQGTTLESLMLIFLPHPIIFASFYNTLTSTYYSLIQCSNCFKKERDDFASLMLSSSSYNIAIFSHHPGLNNALQTYATNDTPQWSLHARHIPSLTKFVDDTASLFQISVSHKKAQNYIATSDDILL